MTIEGLYMSTNIRIIIGLVFILMNSTSTHTMDSSQLVSIDTAIKKQNFCEFFRLLENKDDQWLQKNKDSITRNIESHKLSLIGVSPENAKYVKITPDQEESFKYLNFMIQGMNLLQEQRTDKKAQEAFDQYMSNALKEW